MCFCAYLRPFAAGLERDGLFGPELEFAVFVDFCFGLQATRHFDAVCENALTYFVDRFGSIDHATGREIEIVRHAVEHRGV